MRATPPLMRVLSVARHLYLPDWLVFSGAVYQPVLNHLTGRPLDYGIRDYDLAYFDASDLSYEAEDAATASAALTGSRCDRVRTCVPGAIELLFPGGEKILWNGASWSYIPV
jgi:hypothetical protein